MTTKTARVAIVVAVLSLLGCPGTGGLPSDPRGSSGVNPDKCGEYKLTEAGKKIYAFLVATVELQKAVKDLQNSVKDSCKVMATELGIATSGDTRTLCRNVAQGIRDHLEVGLKAEARFEVKYQPAVCTVDVNAAMRASAECEAQASASASVTCTGTCSGTCKGTCEGTCRARNASGQCEGECKGTCRGECSGSCQGSAEAQGSAECRAAAEVRANANVTCTEPELEVVYDAGMVVDASKVEAVKRAVQKGLPKLLQTGAKAQVAARAVKTWGQTAAQLHGAGRQLVEGFGDASLCVLGQIGAAFEAVASVQVEIEISVEASVEVGGACNASST